MAKNILICDDAAFMRMMIKDILTKNGYNIAGEAENGKVAVDKYVETKPDLVMMDITMPEMDGIQALKKIKETDPGATVIMCSAMGQQSMVIEAIQAGAKDFIVKPDRKNLSKPFQVGLKKFLSGGIYMTATAFLQYCLTGISIGGIYALIAIGYIYHM